MGKRAVDQQAVVNRWQEVADDLATAIRVALSNNYRGVARIDEPERLNAALRRYDEAKRQ